MIQRIQTVYLLLSAIVTIVCACLPVGSIQPEGMGLPSEVYNLCVIDGATGAWSYASSGLFAFMLGTTLVAVVNIFGYNNRKVQMKECSRTIVMLLLWYAIYAFEAWYLTREGGAFGIEPAACLPAVAIILQWLARRGIVHDEKLIRSVDRIR